MKTLAQRLDEEEAALDERYRLRALIDEALRNGQKSAADLLRQTRSTFGYDRSLDRLILR